MLVQEHGAQLGEIVGRGLERGEDRAIVDRQREQLHLVGDGAVGPVGQVVSARIAYEAGDLFDGGDRDGEAGEQHAAGV